MNFQCKLVLHFNFSYLIVSILNCCYLKANKKSADFILKCNLNIYVELFCNYLLK